MLFSGCEPTLGRLSVISIILKFFGAALGDHLQSVTKYLELTLVFM